MASSWLLEERNSKEENLETHWKFRRASNGLRVDKASESLQRPISVPFSGLEVACLRKVAFFRGTPYTHFSASWNFVRRHDRG